MRAEPRAERSAKQSCEFALMGVQSLKRGQMQSTQHITRKHTNQPTTQTNKIEPRRGIELEKSTTCADASVFNENGNYFPSARTAPPLSCGHGACERAARRRKTFKKSPRDESAERFLILVQSIFRSTRSAPPPPIKPRKLSRAKCTAQENNFISFDLLLFRRRMNNFCSGSYAEIGLNETT